MQTIYKIEHQGTTYFFKADPRKTHTVAQLARRLQLPINESAPTDDLFKTWYIQHHGSEEYKNLTYSQRFTKEFMRWIKTFTMSGFCTVENIDVQKQKLYN